MCGIVGYVGDRPCRDLLIAGLEKLEYRGYDSAGVSVISDGEIDSVRAVGNLANLRGPGAELAGAGGSVAVATPPATIGLGHTRWATHGRVTEENAHPHGDCEDKIHIVLNGIIENHAELRARSDRRGPRVHLRDRRGDRFSPDRAPLRRGSDGGGPQGFRRAQGSLRVRRHASRPSRHAGRGAGVPAGRRARRGREFRCLGDPALAETRLSLGIKNDEIVTVGKDGVTLTDSRETSRSVSPRR